MKIKKSNAYYGEFGMVKYHFNDQTGWSMIDDGDVKMKLVNEQFGNMSYDTWYLLPQAYSIILTPEQTLQGEF